MKEPFKKYLSKSRQLGFSIFLDPRYTTGFYKDLKNVSTQEYLDFLGRVGDAMSECKISRVMLDLSEMKGSSFSLRAAAVTNINKLVIEKVPCFILAIIKGNDLFENLGMQTALKMALPLSSKFLAGKMFENTEAERTSAMNWLVGFPVPHKLSIQ